MAKYLWKPGARIPINAQGAGERIDALRHKRGGNITPEHVVADAKSPRSPLHSAFEWHNTRAAEQFRRWQANHLLNCLMVIVKVSRDGEEQIKSYRAYVVVTETDQDRSEQVFAYTLDALKQPEYRREILERALREHQAWEQRYHDLEELAEIVVAAARTRERIKA